MCKNEVIIRLTSEQSSLIEEVSSESISELKLVFYEDCIKSIGISGGGGGGFSGGGASGTWRLFDIRE